MEQDWPEGKRQVHLTQARACLGKGSWWLTCWGSVEFGSRQDPFVSLDTEGVGELIEIAVERGRAARKGMKMGICGEHGGDPASIEFCEATGLDYVSCSPFRVPIARLAAAQAAMKKQGEKALQSSTKPVKPRQPAFGPW